MSKQIFRKTSLNKLSSPEELDQIITVTKPRGWIALLGLICILITGIIWSLVGSIPIQVNGVGMITASEGVANVIHPVSGRITDVSVRPGDFIKKGDIIARIELGELVDEINLLTRDIELVKAFDVDTFDINDMELAASLNEIYTIALQIQNGTSTNRDPLFRQLETTRAVKISELENKLNDNKEKLEMYSSVVSQVEGRILEVYLEKGQIMQAGSPAAKVIREDKTVNSLEVVLYVSPEKGKLITAGMDAHISPTIVKKEEYGYMLGKVISVSEYPISMESLVKTLGSEELAGMFSQDDAPIEVRVNLIPDSSTFSGFAWSTPKGPDINIDGGTISAGSIVIEERRPIELVLPFLNNVLN